MYCHCNECWEQTVKFDNDLGYLGRFSREILVAGVKNRGCYLKVKVGITRATRASTSERPFTRTEEPPERESHRLPPRSPSPASSCI